MDIINCIFLYVLATYDWLFLQIKGENKMLITKYIFSIIIMGIILFIMGIGEENSWIFFGE